MTAFSSTILPWVLCWLVLRLPVACLAAEDSWPLFRGDAQATGVAVGELPPEMELLWSYRVEKGGFEATPVIANDLVFLPDLDGTLHVLKLEDGQLAWKKSFAAADGVVTGFIASPAIDKDDIYLCDMDGKVYCLALADGQEKWTFTTGAEIDGAVSFFQNRVLVGSQDSNLYCLQMDSGELVWKFAIADQIRCSPTIADHYSFVAGCDGQLHIVDIVDGTEVTKVPIEDPTGVTPAVHGDNIYFGTEGGKLFCINWKKGGTVWTRRANATQQPFRGSPAVTENVLIVTGRDKRVRALSPKTGDEIWSYTTKAGIDSSPVIVGGRVFVAGSDGRVYGLDVTTGTVVWQYESGGKFASSPAVAAGRLIVANDAGTVFCFGKK